MLKFKMEVVTAKATKSDDHNTGCRLRTVLLEGDI